MPDDRSPEERTSPPREQLPPVVVVRDAATVPDEELQEHEPPAPA